MEKNVCATDCVKMSEGQILEAIRAWRLGTFHTVRYVSGEKGKKLADLRKEKTYKIHYCEYENCAQVVAYRAETGVGPNNPAVINEEKTDIPFVYLNPKTNKIKLRTPLLSLEVLNDQYFIGEQEVSKEVYKAEIVARGYKLPEHAPSKTGKNYLSLDISRMLWVR